MIDQEALCDLNDADAGEYVLLRGLGRTISFRASASARGINLQRWLRRCSTMDYQTMHRALVCWKPYSGLIYFHLLLDRLEEAGMVSGQ